MSTKVNIAGGDGGCGCILAAIAMCILCLRGCSDVGNIGGLKRDAHDLKAQVSALESRVANLEETDNDGTPATPE